MRLVHQPISAAGPARPASTPAVASLGRGDPEPHIAYHEFLRVADGPFDFHADTLHTPPRRARDL